MWAASLNLAHHISRLTKNLVLCLIWPQDPGEKDDTGAIGCVSRPVLAVHIVVHTLDGVERDRRSRPSHSRCYT